MSNNDIDQKKRAEKAVSLPFLWFSSDGATHYVGDEWSKLEKLRTFHEDAGHSLIVI